MPDAHNSENGDWSVEPTVETGRDICILQRKEPAMDIPLAEDNSKAIHPNIAYNSYPARRFNPVHSMQPFPHSNPAQSVNNCWA